jgi:DNA-binding MarR family transcriptional regulator
MARTPRTVYLVGQMNAFVRARLERTVREHDLTVVQCTVLSRIKGREVMSSARLARAHSVSPQTMNELIAGLENRGLISRREDPENRRVLLVSLTPAGHELLRACDLDVDALETNCFAALTPQQHEAFREAMELLIAESRKVTDN